MAPKSKKDPVTYPVSLGTGAKVPMVSLEVKSKRRGRAGSSTRRTPPADEPVRTSTASCVRAAEVEYGREDGRHPSAVGSVPRSTYERMR
jgi:hypothetical protein